jgi:hypothetical protein
MTSQEDNFIVGFDLDGVIIDHTPNKLVLARQYGVMLSPEETHSEIISQHLSPERYSAFQDELYGDSDLALSASLMAGAFDVLTRLKNEGVPFVLISRRRKPENAIALLSRRRLWGQLVDEHNTLFNEENTVFVRTAAEKNTAAVAWNITHYIDDERKVLEAMPSVPTRLLFDAFEQFTDEKQFPRLFNWEMLYEALRPTRKV